MATIAHLSDIHFGHHDPVVVEGVEAFLHDKKPDLVVISGDFTQRARVKQYRLACEFIERIEGQGLPVLAVPGNHDVPLYDVVRRFARPLHRYKRFVDNDLCPYWENDELEVLGLNTARSFTIKDGSISFTIKDGSISFEQLHTIREAFSGGAEGKTRILVTHHPLFAMPIGDGDEMTKVVNRHTDALAAAAEAGVYIMLAGHFHRSFSKSAREMVENTGPALVIQAGTATSTRLRGDEKQSFNWIRVESGRVEITVHAWQIGGFTHREPVSFSYNGENWI